MRSLLFGAVVLLAGCGKQAPALFPVVGRVLVEGKPVTTGTVQFRADAAKDNKTMEVPTGEIRSDGTFELHTAGKPGAPAGWYRILILADNFRVVDPPPSKYWPDYPPGFLKKPRVHERYLYFNKTDLFVEVVEAPDEGDYDLRLSP